MGRKRFTLELPDEEYEFLHKEANLSGTSVAGLLRELVAEYRRRPARKNGWDYRNDSFYKMGGEFSAPPLREEEQDKIIYENES